MIEDSENGIRVMVFDTNEGIDDWAEVNVSRYPDGSPKNSLNSTELKQVADMLYVMAEKME